MWNGKYEMSGDPGSTSGASGVTAYYGQGEPSATSNHNSCDWVRQSDALPALLGYLYRAVSLFTNNPAVLEPFLYWEV